LRSSSSDSSYGDAFVLRVTACSSGSRRVVLTGLESLTASERRVAEHASQGLSNREIAQTLFVTARTVEGHLTSIFRKLQLDSRSELADALADG
jgi:DNA-binding CsgD family transcriptional regulator